MRSVSLGAIFASLILSVLGRYLPPEIFANISQLRRGANLSLSTGTAILSPPNVPALPGPAPIYPADGVGEGGGDNDGAVTAQRPGGSANDELWNKHIRKGNSLMCAMCGTDAGAGWQAGDTRTPPSAASIWVNFNDMVDWYWWEAGHNPSICDMAMYWGMRTTFQGLKINPKSKKAGGNLQCFQIRHRNEKAKYPDGKCKEALAQSYVVGGKMYHVCFKPNNADVLKVADDHDEATNAEHFFAMDVRAGGLYSLLSRFIH